MRMLVIGILIGFLIIAFLGGLFLIAGSFNTAATVPIGRLEQGLATFALNRSVKRRAPGMKNALPFAPENLREGLAHYRANCVVCHGAPGVDATDFGQGLNPPAPNLTLSKVQARPNGQLFWIVSEGIRMTGMPAFSRTHSRDQIWKTVAFLRHLPQLTDEERRMLKAGSDQAGHHDGGSMTSPKEKEESGGTGNMKHGDMK